MSMQKIYAAKLEAVKEFTLDKKSGACKSIEMEVDAETGTPFMWDQLEFFDGSMKFGRKRGAREAVPTISFSTNGASPKLHSLLNKMLVGKVVFIFKYSSRGYRILGLDSGLESSTFKGKFVEFTANSGKASNAIASGTVIEVADESGEPIKVTL